MKFKLIIISFIFIFSFMQFELVYADMIKNFNTGGYWLGCFDIYFEIDFYLYSSSNEKFIIKLTNLDYGEFSKWKIENHKLYLWIPPNENKYKFVCDLPTEVWLRLKTSYEWSYFLDFQLVYSENDVPIYTVTDFIGDNEAWNWDIPKYLESPCFGINPNGNMEFRIIVNNGNFALSKVHIHSSQKWFTFITDTQLDDEFNDDSLVQWDTFDLSGFNYSIIHETKDSYIKIWSGVEPSNPTERVERQWWEKLRDKIWNDLTNTWNYITSTIASFLPKQLVDFFNWLWDALNWLWNLITFAFSIVLGFAPYFSLIIIFSFLGSIFECLIYGDIEPLIDNVYFWYNLARGVISSIASVVNTIYNFIKVW